MRKFLFLLTELLLLSLCAPKVLPAMQRPSLSDSLSWPDNTEKLYRELFLMGTKPDYKAFAYGMEGYQMLQKSGRLSNPHIITIIDYSQPSNQRRLWVIDLEHDTVLYNSLVAHGKKSGEIMPTQFSNTPHSNMSSVGFFITGEPYYGKHGYSLRIDGAEPGINDKARQRAIVIHAADYVSLDFIKKYGRLGRSFGCPALPPAKSQPIIDTIKNKTCLFIYAPLSEYPQQSKLIQSGPLH